MGLFSSRPEEPSEWAGLPSEPRDAEAPADHLDAPAGALIDALPAVDAVHSILIPVSPVVEVADTSSPTANDD
jgi:hypothetical protein